MIVCKTTIWRGLQFLVTELVNTTGTGPKLMFPNLSVTAVTVYAKVCS